LGRGCSQKKRKIKALLLTARTIVGENKEGNTKIHTTNSTNMIGKKSFSLKTKQDYTGFMEVTVIPPSFD
jgi:hypothetical protein